MSLDPLVSCVSLAALRHYRLVYPPEASEAAPVKIFEHRPPS